MTKLTLKELRTTLKVLEQLGDEVPEELFVHISDIIRDTEAENWLKRSNRMTEEEFIKHDQHRPTRLRVTTQDGRIVHHKRNEQTFFAALQLIEPDLLRTIEFCIGRRRFVYDDITHKRLRKKGYKLLSPGLFIHTSFNLHEQIETLCHLNKILKLGWSIETI